jgi:hypothetical protein
LRDLTLSEEGNPPEVNGMVNWERYVLISDVLETIRQMQKVLFEFLF